MRLHGETEKAGNRNGWARCALILSCVGLGAWVAPHRALAQDQLEEITVTATKRDTNLQSTAIAITSFNLQELSQSQSLSISDLQMTTPGLWVGADNGLGNNPMAIRGIGSINLSLGADEAVGTYIDGVYQGRPYTSEFQFIDASDIEVLRGPQGTLYGRNATGGAILINTLTPGPDTVLNGDFTGTQLNGFEGHGIASGPIVPGTLYGKIAVGESSRDGYSINTLTGQALNGYRNYQLSSALRWTPEESVDTTLRIFYGVNDNTVASHNVLDGLPINDIPATFPNEGHRNYFGATLNGTFSLPFATLTSITGYVDSGTHTLLSNGDVGLTQYRDENWAHQWYQEVRLASDEKGPITYIIGANAFRENVSDRTDFALLFVPVGLNFFNDLTTTSYAGFVEATAKLISQLRLTAGVRYTHDKKDFDNCLAAGDYTNILTDYTPDGCKDKFTPASNSWNATTPHFVLDYQFTPEVFGYLSATRGFRSGGWNYTEAVSASSAFNPEYVWSYEGGLKSEFLDHRVRTNVSVFQANYTDAQIRVLDPAVDLFNVKNAGKAKIRGVDIEVAAKPSDALRIGANLSWLDAKYTTFSYEQFGGTGEVNYAGNRLDYAPEWQGGLTADYSISVPGGATLMPRVEASYVSEVFFNEQNLPPSDAPGHAVINLRLRYTAQSALWGVQLFVDNLTSHQSPQYSFVGSPPNVLSVYFGPPRIAGAQVFWKLK
jgi:iron complex outermembrane recepter protein